MFRVLGTVRWERPEADEPQCDDALLSKDLARLSKELASYRKRVIVALLLANVGKVVHIERMIDAIWVTDPPQTCRQQVMNCIGSVRRTLARVADKVSTPARPPVAIVADRNGYCLRADPSLVDACVFESVARDVTELRADQRRSADLRWALDLWTGPAYDGLPSVELQAEAVRLEELRLVATETLIRHDLDNGVDPALHIADLQALTRLHAYREELRLLHMEALHRCGRTAEALASYREYRQMLLSEHAIEPGRRLRDKEAEILRRA